MVSYPIDVTLAVGDPAHVDHHVALAESANDHQTRLGTVETDKLAISAAAELIRDTMGTTLVEGANITITVDDVGDTITIAAAGGGGGGGGAPLYLQPLCDVGGTFTSSFWTSSSTNNLRDQSTTCMPILIDTAITIDQISFNVTVVGAAAATADIYLCEFDQTGQQWDAVGAALATGIAVDGATGVRAVSITPLALSPGLYGFRLQNPGTFDSALRITGGKLVGPGIGAGSGYNASNLPLGTNTATVVAVPMLRLRRSA